MSATDLAQSVINSMNSSPSKKKPKSQASDQKVISRSELTNAFELLDSAKQTVPNVDGTLE